MRRSRRVDGSRFRRRGFRSATPGFTGRRVAPFRVRHLFEQELYAPITPTPSSTFKQSSGSVQSAARPPVAQSLSTGSGAHRRLRWPCSRPLARPPIGESPSARIVQAGTNPQRRLDHPEPSRPTARRGDSCPGRWLSRLICQACVGVRVRILAPARSGFLHQLKNG